jgi:hypothetical protein
VSETERLRDGWKVLEALAGGDLRLRFLSSDGGSPAIGLDVAGRRHLLFPIERDMAVVEDQRSGGVRFSRRVLEDESGGRVFVDVVCAKAHLNELFDIVASEMVEEVASYGADRPDVGCRRVLDRWRELLDREADAVSGVEKVIGMFGELFHLRELVRIDPRAVELWTGPIGSRHDFQGSGASLEVKTTQTRQGRFFEISSHDQLEPLPGLPLYLGCLKVERVASSGDTLMDLIAELTDLGADRGRIKTLMAQAGMKPADLEKEAPAFRVVEHRLYDVDLTFPGVTSRTFVGGQLPAGVMRLRYLLDLSSEPPNPIPTGLLSEVFRTIVGAP